MIPRDTSAAAHWVQVERCRKMSPSERVAITATMSEDLRTLAATGIQNRHPDYSAADVRFALFRVLLGDELFRKAWPDAPVLAP